MWNLPFSRQEDLSLFASVEILVESCCGIEMGCGTSFQQGRALQISSIMSIVILGTTT
jgi:hypothetical protein